MQIGQQDLFMISRERRYGLHSESYSALNGYIRSHENYTAAAERILSEGYGIASGRLEYTGKYRIQVNRGTNTALHSMARRLSVLFLNFPLLLRRWRIFAHIYCSE